MQSMTQENQTSEIAARFDAMDAVLLEWHDDLKADQEPASEKTMHALTPEDIESVAMHIRPLYDLAAEQSMRESQKMAEDILNFLTYLKTKHLDALKILEAFQRTYLYGVRHPDTEDSAALHKELKNACKRFLAQQKNAKPSA